MTDVEFVMEVEGRLTEVLFDFRMELKCTLDNWGYQFLNGSLKLGEVLI